MNEAIEGVLSTPPKKIKVAEIGRSTLKQSERQQRVIAAALELAAQFGTPEAIQMRDIAARSNVSLGTIYKYYRSKDQILAFAFVQWAGRLEIDLSLTVSHEAPMIERVVALLRQASQAMEREPNLARAQFLSVISSGRQYGLDQNLIGVLRRLLASVLSDMSEPNLKGFQTIITHVWVSSFIYWMNGLCDLSHVGDGLEFACRWLLDGPPLPVCDKRLK